MVNNIVYILLVVKIFIYRILINDVYVFLNFVMEERLRLIFFGNIDIIDDLWYLNIGRLYVFDNFF